jgi:hypothetical protein
LSDTLFQTVVAALRDFKIEKLDPSLNGAGWIDLERFTVEVRPSEGLGLYTTPHEDAGFGEGPNEVFSQTDIAGLVCRIRELNA